MDIESDISRAAALIAQGLSLVERIEFADAVRGVSTLEQIPQKYREQISVLIKKKEARHIPGQHDQMTHGKGGGGGRVARPGMGDIKISNETAADMAKGLAIDFSADSTEAPDFEVVKKVE